MIKQQLQKIAEQENGNYDSRDQSFFGLGMSKTPMTRHHLEIEYKGHLIQIFYELGNYNLAKIECALPQNTFIPNFEIKVTNHYRRLFNRKLNSLEVHCKDVGFKKILMDYFEKTGLEKIGRDNSFEPKMFTKLEDNSLKFISEYSLEFPDKIKALEAMIRFYKSMIDFFIKN